jgi:predicted DNA-binding transcriptional regulator AlpA
VSSSPPLELHRSTLDGTARSPADGDTPALESAEPTLAPLLVDTDQAAAMCAVSPATWYRLKAGGKTPAPIRLGGRVLYRLTDLVLWVSLGCPGRKEFEARLAARNTNSRK